MYAKEKKRKRKMLTNVVTVLKLEIRRHQPRLMWGCLLWQGGQHEGRQKVKEKQRSNQMRPKPQSQQRAEVAAKFLSALNIIVHKNERKLVIA